jgi:hypothetical protein
MVTDMGWPAVGAARGTENLILVLEATMNGPTAQLPAPDCVTASKTKGERRQQSATHQFSRQNGAPARGKLDCVRNKEHQTDEESN